MIAAELCETRERTPTLHKRSVGPPFVLCVQREARGDADAVFRLIITSSIPPIIVLIETPSTVLLGYTYADPMAAGFGVLAAYVATVIAIIVSVWFIFPRQEWVQGGERALPLSLSCIITLISAHWYSSRGP